jgi:hypothetical protein
MQEKLKKSLDFILRPSYNQLMSRLLNELSVSFIWKYLIPKKYTSLTKEAAVLRQET